MNRREYLAVAASAGTAAFSGCTTISNFLNSSGVERVEWVNLDILEIHFAQDHEMDGFVVMHELDDDPTRDAIVTKKAPPYSGPEHVRLIRRIRRGDRVYPNRSFKIAGYTGSFGFINLFREKTGEFGFTIPASIMPRAKWRQSK